MTWVEILILLAAVVCAAIGAGLAAADDLERDVKIGAGVFFGGIAAILVLVALA